MAGKGLYVQLWSDNIGKQIQAQVRYNILSCKLWGIIISNQTYIQRCFCCKHHFMHYFSPPTAIKRREPVCCIIRHAPYWKVSVLNLVTIFGSVVHCDQNRIMLRQRRLFPTSIQRKQLRRNSRIQKRGQRAIVSRTVHTFSHSNDKEM